MMKPLIALSLTLAACADDPISYSDDVGIALKADVVDGMVVDEKNINTESGNPYAAFIADARRALGTDPGSIEVDRVELAIENGSSIAQLGQVFGGDVEVVFQINDTDRSYLVASGTIRPDLGAQQLAVSFSSAAVDAADAADYPRLVSGGFKVILTGPAAAGFDGTSGTADLQVTFNFAAFE